MKKSKNNHETDMLPEYDFNGGIRGKYAKKFREEGSNVVVLSPSIARFFPNSQSVNEALEGLLSLFKKTRMAHSSQ